MPRVIDIVWVVLDPSGDLICIETDEEKAELEAETRNELFERGYHVKEAQLIWNE